MHRLLVTHVVDVEAFCAYLRAVHVHVQEVDGATVVAALPGAATPLHERRELIGYVATWNALNPTSPVELGSPDEASEQPPHPGRNRPS